MSTRRKLAFALVPLALALAGLEAMVRVVRAARQRALEARPDYQAYLARVAELRRYYAATRRRASPFRYENVPLADHMLRGVRYRYDAHGLREDRVIAAAPAAGTLRVALVGDSVGQGLYVPLESTCGRVIERESRRPVEVLNFSVDGLETFDQYHVVRERALAFRPGAVVLLVCLNDLFDRRHVGGPAEAEPVVDPVSGRFALLDAVLERAERALTGAGALPSAIAFEAFAHNLDALAKLLERHRVRMVVAVAPLHLENAGVYQALAARVLERARVSGAITADLWAAFRGAGQDALFPPASASFLYPRDYWHPSAAGHERMGRALAAALTRLPATP